MKELLENAVSQSKNIDGEVEHFFFVIEFVNLEELDNLPTDKKKLRITKCSSSQSTGMIQIHILSCTNI